MSSPPPFRPKPPPRTYSRSRPSAIKRKSTSTGTQAHLPVLDDSSESSLTPVSSEDEGTKTKAGKGAKRVKLSAKTKPKGVRGGRQGHGGKEGVDWDEIPESERGEKRRGIEDGTGRWRRTNDSSASEDDHLQQQHRVKEMATKGKGKEREGSRIGRVVSKLPEPIMVVPKAEKRRADKGRNAIGEEGRASTHIRTVSERTTGSTTTKLLPPRRGPAAPVVGRGAAGATSTMSWKERVNARPRSPAETTSAAVPPSRLRPQSKRTISQAPPVPPPAVVPRSSLPSRTSSSKPVTAVPAVARPAQPSRPKATGSNSLPAPRAIPSNNLPPSPAPRPPLSRSPSKAASRPSTPTQSRHSTPTSLTPTQVRHQLVATPSNPARKLSALFEFHGKLLATGSSPELTSPQKYQKRQLLLVGDDKLSSPLQSDDEAPAGLMVNLPRNPGGLVGRMLKRSNTAPDAPSLSGAGSSSLTGAGLQQLAPIGSPARRIGTDGGSSYFAMSQSTSQLPASPSRGPPSTPGSAPPSPAPAAGPTRPSLQQRRTYGGGTTRSMLASMDQGTLGGDGFGDEEERGESYAVLSKRWGIEEEGGESQDIVDLPTITELRARGENQRFLDDLGYIVDGLQGDSVAVKRPSAVDLVRRLLNTDFRRSIKTLDEAENLYNVMREAGAGDGDMVLDAALSIFLAILAKDERSIEPILRRKGEDCFVVVGKMLRSREDGFSLARGVEGGKAVKQKDRVAVNLITELRRIYGLFEVGVEGSSISLRAVASSIFASVITYFGSRMDRFAVLEGAGVSKCIAASLEAEIETLPSRIKGHEKGLPLLPQNDPPDFEHIENCLTVLENLVVRFPEAQQMVESTRPRLPSLFGTLLAACHCLVGDTENEDENSLALIGMNCLVTALRVLVNVTNTSPFWCEGVLQSQPVITTILRLIHTSHLPTPDSPRLIASLLSSPGKVFPSSSLPPVSDISGDAVDESKSAAALVAATEALKVDVLCLSLGLLNNLVEGVESARDRVRETELSSTCTGSRTCVLQCRCSDRRSGLLLLVDFYSKQVQGTSTEASYLSGYSVLLLSHLLSSSPTNATIILDALPSLPLPPSQSPFSSPLTSSSSLSAATHAAKLDSLILELRDFADVHQRFHQKLTTITAQVAANEDDEEEEEGMGKGVLPAVVPSMEEGVGAVQRMIGVLEGLREGL